MVEPGFFALTSTPSIGPSRSDVILPPSAGGAPCADAGAAKPTNHAAKAKAAIRAIPGVAMRSSHERSVLGRTLRRTLAIYGWPWKAGTGYRSPARVR